MSNSGKVEIMPSTYLAVLSLIGGGAQYGYEIDKILEEKGYRNWVDIKVASVYKALTQLEKRGLIQGTKTRTSLQPSKKTYKLTPKGKRTLTKQIAQCLSNPPKANSLFDLGMSAIFLLTKENALAALRERASNLEKQSRFMRVNIEAIESFEQLRKSDPDRLLGSIRLGDVPIDSQFGVVQALFKRPYVRIRCERDWLLQLIEKIEHDEAGFRFKEEKKRKR